MRSVSCVSMYSEDTVQCLMMQPGVHRSVLLVETLDFDQNWVIYQGGGTSDATCLQVYCPYLM